MYDALSEEEKLFFHPPMFERSSLRWVLEQGMLALSCYESIRGLLLSIFPKAVVIPVVANNDRGEILAFTYVKVLSKLSNSGYSALDGIVVIEGYRDMGLGYKMMLLRNRIVRMYRIGWIWTWIVASNVRMLSLARKLGYKFVGETRIGYKGLQYEAYEAVLKLQR